MRLGIRSTLAVVGEQPAATALDDDPGNAPTMAADVAAAATEVAPEAGGEQTSGDSATRPLIEQSVSERYTTVCQLGEGGMGVVEQVWDSDLMRTLALKRMRAPLRSDRHLLRQFLWEARVGAYLDHPNIVPVHDLGLTDEGELYFTMKHVRGASLEDLLSRLYDDDPEATRDYPLARRLRIFHKLCEAMSFAHSRGVVHRDLKPANVMLGEHGEVFVMDWGIAVPSGAPETLQAAVPETVGDGISGTPGYMSPEQARGEPVDARSDVYTLGAILYELVALMPPIEGESLAELLEHARGAVHVPLREAKPTASPSIVAIVERALALEPEQRYQDVDALARDVETVMDGRTPAAEDVTIVRRLGRYWISRDRARLRPLDLDMLMLAGTLFGCALGLWLPRTLSRWWWIFVAAAALVGIPPFLSWFRGTRGDLGD